MMIILIIEPVVKPLAGELFKHNNAYFRHYDQGRIQKSGLGGGIWYSLTNLQIPPHPGIKCPKFRK